MSGYLPLATGFQPRMDVPSSCKKIQNRDLQASAIIRIAYARARRAVSGYRRHDSGTANVDIMQGDVAQTHLWWLCLPYTRLNGQKRKQPCMLIRSLTGSSSVRSQKAGFGTTSGSKRADLVPPVSLDFLLAHGQLSSVEVQNMI